jgi:hypothetical protein
MREPASLGGYHIPDIVHAKVFPPSKAKIMLQTHMIKGVQMDRWLEEHIHWGSKSGRLSHPEDHILSTCLRLLASPFLNMG